MKKKHIVTIVVCLVALLCIGIIIAVISKKNKPNNVDPEKDIIVYDTDDETVEEESEDGLNVSDSEDGPVFKEENMIDFNGSDDSQSNNDDAKDDNKQGDNTTNDNQADNSDGVTDDATNSDDVTDGDDVTDSDDKDEASKETGTWGTFY